MNITHLVSKWKRGFAVPAWMLIGWSLIETAHTLTWVSEQIGGVWKFLTSPIGNLVAICSGFAWLIALHFWPKSPEEKNEPFSANSVFIASVKPGLTLSRHRSWGDIEFRVFTPVQLELIYTEIKVLCKGMEAAIFERNKPVLIPSFNPQEQHIGKYLTEKELERLDQPEGTFYQFDGLARFKGPNSEEFDKQFSFMSAAWKLPDPAN